MSQKPITCGVKIVWGLPAEVKPIACDIPGTVRLVLGHREAARAYIETPKGCSRCFVLIDEGDRWIVDPRMEQRQLSAEDAAGKILECAKRHPWLLIP